MHGLRVRRSRCCWWHTLLHTRVNASPDGSENHTLVNRISEQGCSDLVLRVSSPQEEFENAYF